MGPFYVQIKHPAEYVHYTHNYMMIILFRDMDMADEWWRTISVDNRCANLKRTSPCYYVDTTGYSQNGYVALHFIRQSIENNDFVRVIWPFRDQVLGGTHPQPIIPPQDVTDHISGKTFYIRSKADPRDFWHVPRRGTDFGKLLVSRTDRTRFRITAKDAPAPFDGGPIVMIGSDAIEIAEARTGRLVRIDSSGYLELRAPASASGGVMSQLVVEERSEVAEQLAVEEHKEQTAHAVETGSPEADISQVLFNDLKTKFSVVPEDSSPVFGRATRRLEVGDGEEWELV